MPERKRFFAVDPFPKSLPSRNVIPPFSTYADEWSDNISWHWKLEGNKIKHDYHSTMYDVHDIKVHTWAWSKSWLITNNELKDDKKSVKELKLDQIYCVWLIKWVLKREKKWPKFGFGALHPEAPKWVPPTAPDLFEELNICLLACSFPIPWYFSIIDKLRVTRFVG